MKTTAELIAEGQRVMRSRIEAEMPRIAAEKGWNPNDPLRKPALVELAGRRVLAQVLEGLK